MIHPESFKIIKKTFAIDIVLCYNSQAVTNSVTNSYLCVHNESCTNEPDAGQWELAHNWQAYGSDVYDECRDSERLKASNMSA